MSEQTAIPPEPLSTETSAKLANMGFLCACLVVFIHVPMARSTDPVAWWFHFLTTGILCRIAVPFFFVASGFLLARHARSPGWWKAENKKRLRTLLVPYLSWSLLYAACSVIQVATGHGHPTVNASGALRMGVLYLGLDPFATPWLSPLWYVRNLIALSILSPVLIHIIGRNRPSGLLWLTIAYAAYSLVPYDSHSLPCIGETARFFFRWTFSLEGLFFYSLGIFLQAWPTRITMKGRNRLFLSVLPLCLSIGGGLLVHKGYRHGLYLVWLSLPPILLSCWRLIPGKSWPRYLTGSSFPLYCQHFFII